MNQLLSVAAQFAAHGVSVAAALERRDARASQQKQPTPSIVSSVRKKTRRKTPRSVLPLRDPKGIVWRDLLDL